MAVRSSTINWGDIVASTLEGRSSGLADNITGNTALLDRLKKRGKVKPYNGGRTIVENLEYAFNDSFQFYSGYELLNTSPNEVFTAAEFPIKQASIAVSISGLELRMNRGDAEVFDLLEGRIANAERSALHYFNQSVYGDGTGFGGKAIQGLEALVSKTPQVGTVGGIDAAQHPFWRNVAINASDDPKGAVTEDNIVAYMNQMSIALTRGTESPDLILYGNDYFQKYLEAIQDKQRITSTGDSEAGAGFTTLKYFGGGKAADVVLDGGRDGALGEKTGYFLNTEFLRLRVDPERNWNVVGGDRQNTNQDAIVKLMLWAGALTVTNRAAQGVLFED